MSDGLEKRHADPMMRHVLSVDVSEVSRHQSSQVRLILCSGYRLILRARYMGRSRFDHEQPTDNQQATVSREQHFVLG